LPYGGWVAPNIYYLGYAGVLQVAGIRIAGLSGIYKSQHWMQGHYERPPYNDSSIRSIYHVRNLEVFRLKQVDIDFCFLDSFISFLFFFHVFIYFPHFTYIKHIRHIKIYSRNN
jgi:hypothetical protein